MMAQRSRFPSSYQKTEHLKSRQSLAKSKERKLDERLNQVVEKLKLNVSILLFDHPSVWPSRVIKLHSMLSGSLLMPDSVEKTRSILSAALEYQLDDRHIQAFITLLVWQSSLQRKLPYTAKDLFVYAEYELVSFCRKAGRTSVSQGIDSIALLSTDWSAYNTGGPDAYVFLYRHMKTLDPWSKYLLYLHLYEEMSVRDIANMLGYAKSSVHESLTYTLNAFIGKEKQ